MRLHRLSLNIPGELDASATPNFSTIVRRDSKLGSVDIRLARQPALRQAHRLATFWRGAGSRGQARWQTGEHQPGDHLQECMGLVISASPSGGAMGSDKTLALISLPDFCLVFRLAWLHTHVLFLTRKPAASQVLSLFSSWNSQLPQRLVVTHLPHLCFTALIPFTIFH